MIFTCISDTHWIHNKIELPGGDVLCHTGDAELNSKSKVKNFIKWMEDQDYKHLIFVPGNHDIILPHDLEYFTKLFANHGIHMLIDKTVEIEGYKIYGMPWTPRFGTWSFMGGSEFMKEKADLIPTDTDILLSHGPPQGIRDNVSPHRAMVGCPHLLNKVVQIRPTLHAFGHIHESYGFHVFHDTLYVNAAVAPSYFSGLKEPISVVLDGKKAKDIYLGKE